MNPSEPAAIPAGQTPGARAGTTWLHVGFVVTGMATVLLGPILPTLQNNWKIGDAKAGLLFTAQFSSSTAGVLASSWLMRRWGFRACLVIGYLLMGMGVAALVLGSWATGMVSAAAFGAGLGLVIPATNLAVAQSSERKSSARLSWLNLAWGIGAVTLPLLAGAFVKIERLDLLLAAVGTAAALVALRLGTLVGDVAPAMAERRETEAGATRERTEFGLLVILCAIFFLYVGAENSFGGWIAAYARSVRAGTPAEWAMIPFFFWGALLTGRALAPAVLRETNEMRVGRVGLATAAAGGMALIFASGFAGVAAGAAVGGFGLSMVFPIAIARFSSLFGKRAARYVGVLFALGGAGGAVLPWAVGYTANQTGELGTALWIPVGACVVMAGLFFNRELSAESGLSAATPEHPAARSER
jgi:fucose permease